MVANWDILNKEFDDLMNKLSDDEWIAWYSQIDAQKESLRKDILLSAKIQEKKISPSLYNGVNIFNEVQTSMQYDYINNELVKIEENCECVGGRFTTSSLKMETQSGLSFVKFDITKFLFDRGDEQKTMGKYNIKVDCNCSINNDNQNLFISTFIIDITDQEEKLFSFQIKALGYFEILGTIDESVRKNFMNISAPAIVYPYIRSFISNTLLQSGMQPIMLPPMNFAGKTSGNIENQGSVSVKKSAPKKKQI